MTMTNETPEERAQRIAEADATVRAVRASEAERPFFERGQRVFPTDAGTVVVVHGWMPRERALWWLAAWRMVGWKRAVHKLSAAILHNRPGVWGDDRRERFHLRRAEARYEETVRR